MRFCRRLIFQLIPFILAAARCIRIDPAWLITLLKGVEPPLKRNLRKLLLGLTESKTAKWREGQS